MGITKTDPSHYGHLTGGTHQGGAMDCFTRGHAEGALGFQRNIYHHDATGNWMQEDSHHTNEDGSINLYNLKRDTKTTDRVLISDDYYYLGRNCITLPPDLLNAIWIGIGQKQLSEEVVLRVVDFVERNCPEKGYLGEPHKFNSFERYDGQ